jgi:hypothetical protein
VAGQQQHPKAAARTLIAMPPEAPLELSIVVSLRIKRSPQTIQLLSFWVWVLLLLLAIDSATALRDLAEAGQARPFAAFLSIARALSLFPYTVLCQEYQCCSPANTHMMQTWLPIHPGASTHWHAPTQVNYIGSPALPSSVAAAGGGHGGDDDDGDGDDDDFMPHVSACNRCQRCWRTQGRDEGPPSRAGSGDDGQPAAAASQPLLVHGAEHRGQALGEQAPQLLQINVPLQGAAGTARISPSQEEVAEMEAVRSGLPNCTECWGCGVHLQLLRPPVLSGHVFKGEGGASSEWLFRAGKVAPRLKHLIPSCLSVCGVVGCCVGGC